MSDHRPRLQCSSAIDEVTVYARGALVRRLVDLPSDVPSESFELEVPGLTPCAEAGSVRATVAGDRALVGVRLELAIPEGRAEPAEMVAQRRALESQQRIAKERIATLTKRRGQLLAAQLDAAPEKPRRWRQPGMQVSSALQANEVLGTVTLELDRERARLQNDLEQTERRLAELRSLMAQAGRDALKSSDQPTYTLIARFGPGEGAVARLTFNYRVQSARWWPAYTARIDGDAAQLSLDAFVAQDSLEDWTGVRLSLCTANMVKDIQLPELPSLRLGKPRPAKRSGFRPPPSGLDDLFAGWERAMAQATPAPASEPKPRPQATKTRRARREPTAGGPASTGAVPYLESGALDEAPAGAPARTMSMAPPPAAPPPAPQSLAANMTRAGSIAGGVSIEQIAAAHKAQSAGFAAAQPEGISPEVAWLDFDSLAIGKPDDKRHRGRLVRQPHARQVSSRSPDRFSVPAGARDPRDDVGQFDVRYVARGLADVPSDARSHRLVLQTASAKSRMRLRTVPVESPEVYREVTVDNPFGQPLLAGPMDVLVNGAFVNRGSLPRVGKGGKLTLGLGAEQRIRVARNEHLSEDTVGLLKGTTRIAHRVTIDLASALGYPAEVRVIDRVPKPGDDEVEVSDVIAAPEATDYDQADRSDPIEGGLSWVLSVPPGGETSIQFEYTVEIPSKRELIGGA